MGITHNLSLLNPSNGGEVIFQIPAVDTMAQARDVEIVSWIVVSGRRGATASFLISSRAPATARATRGITTTITIPSRVFDAATVGSGYVRRNPDTTFTVRWGNVGLPG